MSKEIPILFQTEMVRAILDGRKTMTRRIVKHPPHIDELTGGVYLKAFNEVVPIEDYLKSMAGMYKMKVGDILWVRESAYPAFKSTPESSGHIYKADYGFKIDLVKEYTPAGGWKPSIHMPKVAARIWLEVTEVKVERLQDISDGDIAREGVTWNEPLQIGRETRNCKSPAQRAFRSLWGKINGEESWDENPWLWVVSFKVLSTTGKP